MNKYELKNSTLEWISRGFNKENVEIILNSKNNKFASIGKLDLIAKNSINVN